MIFKCKECNDKLPKPINELIKKFPNIYKFCNDDLNKFVLLLRKGVYPFQDMDNWEKFNETTLPLKEAFYSKLNRKCMSEEDYAHAQKVLEMFKMKYRGEYHDLYVQIDTLFSSGLACQACLKKTRV